MHLVRSVRNLARWSEISVVMFPDTVFPLMPLCSILSMRALDRDVWRVGILIYGKKLFEQTLSGK